MLRGAALAVSAVLIGASDNGRARTPPMGWVRAILPLLRLQLASQRAALRVTARVLRRVALAHDSVRQHC